MRIVVHYCRVEQASIAGDEIFQLLNTEILFAGLEKAESAINQPFMNEASKDQVKCIFS